jgi:hypothetical protein
MSVLAFQAQQREQGASKPGARDQPGRPSTPKPAADPISTEAARPAKRKADALPGDVTKKVLAWRAVLKRQMPRPVFSFLRDIIDNVDTIDLTCMTSI